MIPMFSRRKSAPREGPLDLTAREAVTEPTVPTTSAQPAAPEALISLLLKSGVITSLVFVATGLTLTFLRHPDYLSSEDSLLRMTGDRVRPHTLREVLDGLQATQGQAIVMMGLLWMILVPFLRVALSIYVFRQQKDRTYVAITSGVLGLLVLSLALGSTAH
jgi:uncharacterized membrane protein